MSASRGRRTTPRRGRAKGGAKRKGAGKRKRRSRAGRPRGRGLAGRAGKGGAVLALIVVAAVAIGISRLDVDATIRELTLPLEHEDIIRQQSRDKDVPAELIAAVINVESGFSDATSSAGARGLMQITPDTADLIEKLSGGLTFETEDLSDPEINIRYGTFFLRELLDRYEGNVVAALAGYNAGPENAAVWGGAAMEIDDIRFPETRSYVENVLAKRQEYRQKYRRELGL